MTEASQIAEALRLQAEGHSQRTIAKAIGKPRHWVRYQLGQSATNDALPATMIGASLSLYDAACKALAAAKSLNEVKEIADKAAAIAEYARRAKDHSLEIDAKELRILAKRRWGQMAVELKAAGLLAKAAPGNQHTGPVPRENRSIVTLADLGADKKFSASAQKLAAISDRDIEVRLAGWRERAERDASRVVGDLLRGDEKEQRRAACSKCDECSPRS